MTDRMNMQNAEDKQQKPRVTTLRPCAEMWWSIGGDKNEMI